MKSLTDKEQKSYENGKIWKIFYIYKGNFEETHAKDKKYFKVRDHYTGEYRGAAHSICNLKYSVPKEIPIAFTTLDLAMITI